MDPVTLTLGATVAALIAKVISQGEDKAAKAAWEVVGRLVGTVRSRFREHGSDEDQAAIAGLQAAPDSAKRLAALASAIDRHTDTTWRAELESLVKEAKSAGVDVTSLTQSAWGNDNIQIGGVSGSTINIDKH